MAREFRLPDIGEGLTEAEIVRWLVPVGEVVVADQPIVEVETDKAVVEIPSPYAGTVLEHGGAEGDTIEVGSILVVIGDSEASVAEPEDEPVSDEAEVAEAEAEAEVEPEVAEAEASVAEPEDEPVSDEAVGAEEPAEVEAEVEVEAEAISPFEPVDEPTDGSVAPIVGTLSEDAEILDSAEDPSPPLPEAAVKALPLVRKLAREKNVDLSTMAGSGPEGRITREDVLAAAEPAPQVETPEPQPSTAVDQESGEGSHDEVEPQRLSRLRRTIADNMAKSWAEIPHVTTFDDVDATRLLEVRTALSLRYKTTIPLEALVVKAVVPALVRHPEFNSTLDGDDMIVHPIHDVGIAVDTDDGLLVAVIRNAGSKNVLELAEEVARLGEGAKQRSLALDELTGQTFTVSNIGAVGGGHGTPIIPPGTTAILSVGRAKESAVVLDGELAIAPVMPLSLSYDHRVIDGGLGRRFMALVMENLEEPALFLAG